MDGSTVFAEAAPLSEALLQTNFLYKPGIAGGQLAHGGVNPGDELRLRGSTDADLGVVNLESPMDIDVDIIAAAGQSYPIRWDTSFSASVLIGGMVTNTGTITVTGATFIWALLSENRTYAMAANPGFAAFTLFNALPVIQNSGNFNLLNALVLNAGVSMRRVTAGTSTFGIITGVSHATNLNPTVSGATVTATTGQQGLTFQPKWNLPAGTVANFGTLTAVECVEPAVALFGASAGTRNLTAYRGLNFPNFTAFTGTQTIEVIHSALNSGTNRRFLNHTGNAVSTMNGQLRFEVDLIGLTYGASLDYQTGWAAANFYFEQQNTAPAGQLRKSSVTVGATAQRWLWTASTRAEFNWDCDRFSIGAQTGAVGNQVGAFVTPTRTASVGGEWSDFLLTQAGNITIDAAMGLVAGWTINAPTIVLGTGSVTTAAGLNIGGNPTNATNRVGLRIISNPTGGGGVNAALWVTAGRSRFDGIVDINQPIALGGGATATLGTIGGSGPTAAAQAQWVQIEVNGVNHWIPAWT